MAKKLTQEQLIEEAKKNLHGYTDKEIEAFVLGAKFGGVNTVKHHDAEWYRKRDERRAKPNAFIEYLITESPLAQAVENMKRMETYRRSRADMLDALWDVMYDDEEMYNDVLDMVLEILEIKLRDNGKEESKGN